MKEVNAFSFAWPVDGPKERIILYLGRTDKKKGLMNVLTFLNENPNPPAMLGRME